MSLQQITDHTYYLPGASNMGVLAPGDGSALAIDSGLNKDSARNLRRAVEAAGLSLRAIISTHHHADHVGGNAYVLRSLPDVRVYAPPLEAALIEHPILEPTYLHMGANPIAGFRTRWLLAQAAPVHAVVGDLERLYTQPSQMITVEGVALEMVSLPGHSIAQVGIVYDGVCFAADGYFAPEVASKHGILYTHDVARQMHSLDTLAGRDEAWFVPGHGALTPRAELGAALEANRASIHRAHTMVLQALPGDMPTVAARVRQALEAAPGGAELPALGVPQYAIFAGAVAAYLTFLEQQGQAVVALEDNWLVWQRAE